mmetsp:Transcript_23926/g.56254  ORF Transcript_23926/g.56254 Transcript_23926/m.56254 type:complete len:251 (-) Transcript_23926:805-1557(-)
MGSFARLRRSTARPRPSSFVSRRPSTQKLVLSNASEASFTKLYRRPELMRWICLSFEAPTTKRTRMRKKRSPAPARSAERGRAASVATTMTTKTKRWKRPEAVALAPAVMVASATSCRRSRICPLTFRSATMSRSSRIGRTPDASILSSSIVSFGSASVTETRRSFARNSRITSISLPPRSMVCRPIFVPATSSILAPIVSRKATTNSPMPRPSRGMLLPPSTRSRRLGPRSSTMLSITSTRLSRPYTLI